VDNQSGRNVVNPNEAEEQLTLLKNGKKIKTAHKPEVFHPGGSHSITDAALTLGRLLGKARKYYSRGGAVVRVIYEKDRRPSLSSVKAASLTSAFENVAQLVKARAVKGKDGETVWESEPTIFSEQIAKQILESDDFREVLPELNVMARCPVLIERNGDLVEICGYDRKSGILAFGKPTTKVPLEKARELLHEVLCEFQFATAADHARALAALITPAMVFGGLLHGRAPLDLGEADKSQTGKGYRNKITAAIYNQKVQVINQQTSGVGGMEEAFDTYLVSGANFICMDNVKGKINSSKIESFLTEDSYPARVPYQAGVNIDPERTFVMMTSNKADVTQDLANRSSCVRMLKRGDDHSFREYPEGDILDHVRANQPLYLGAVFAVIRQWHQDGMPRSRETHHDFRNWVQKLDYIVQE